MAKFTVIVIGIVYNGERILIGRKKPNLSHPLSGKWHFPGGKLKSKENPYSAIVREIKEETNLSIKPVKIIDTYTSVEPYNQCNKSPKNVLFLIFECKLVKKSKLKAGGDLIEAKWIKLKDIRRILIHDKTLQRRRVKNLLFNILPTI
jgi:8-oxo-dGTP pyrophosphatase MutT (NUDIX family)